jgi:hypothetical protein
MPKFTDAGKYPCVVLWFFMCAPCTAYSVQLLFQKRQILDSCDFLIFTTRVGLKTRLNGVKSICFEQFRKFWSTFFVRKESISVLFVRKLQGVVVLGDIKVLATDANPRDDDAIHEYE